MLSMQQLEELESRVVKALQLISDLRTDNAKLENDNESLKSENEDLKLTLDEKEQEVARIRKELDESTRELQELKDKEEVLEKKIISLLGKLDVVAVRADTRGGRSSQAEIKASACSRHSRRAFRG